MSSFQTLVYTYLLSLFFTPFAWSKSEIWSCLCYQERYQGKAMDVTTCRASQQKCEALQKKVIKGSKTLIKNSMSLPCTQLQAKHPSDVLGSPNKWIPSKKTGATWTPAGCFLKGDSIYSGGKEDEVFFVKESPDAHASILLRSNWIVRTYTDAVKGKAWLELTHPRSKIVQFKKLPTLDALFDRGRKCDSLIFSSGYTVKASKKELIVALNLDCAMIGGDTMSGELFFSLISISNQAQPKVKMLWSAKGSRTSNDLHQEVQEDYYEIDNKKGQMEIWKLRLECKQPKSFDIAKDDPAKTVQCKKTKVLLKTI